MKVRGLFLVFSLFLIPKISFSFETFPYPLFFRVSEKYAHPQKMSLEEWLNVFSKQNGVIGKALDEEIERSHTQKYYRAFKEKYPHQLAILHFNSSARDVRFNSKKFFSGHWLHYEGTRVEKVLGPNLIQVSQPKSFRGKVGRYNNTPEPVSICSMNNTVNWNQCEDAHINSINGTSIELTRGHKKGRMNIKEGSYIAAKVTQGPWGKNNHILYYYNFSEHSPTSKGSKRASDILLSELIHFLKPGGQLHFFDGITLDVLYQDIVTHLKPERGVDFDGDGKGDNRNTNLRKSYSDGVISYLKRLKAELPNKIILSDGQGLASQRGYGIINGIESEGFPSLKDSQLKDWSSGLNRVLFWQTNPVKNSFNYVNHKFRVRDKKTLVPPSKHRLILATSQILGTATTYSALPNKGFMWKELLPPGWLGRPKGKIVFIEKNVRRIDFSYDRKKLVLSKNQDVRKITSNKEIPWINLTLNLPKSQTHLLLRVKMKNSSPRQRLIKLKNSLGYSQMSWLSNHWFESKFLIPKDVTGKPLKLKLEGSSPFYIQNVSISESEGCMYRLFTRGLAIANPSSVPCKMTASGYSNRVNQYDGLLLPLSK